MIKARAIYVKLANCIPLACVHYDLPREKYLRSLRFVKPPTVEGFFSIRHGYLSIAQTIPFAAGGVDLGMCDISLPDPLWLEVDNRSKEEIPIELIITYAWEENSWK